MTITKQFPTITFAKLAILVFTLCGHSPAQDFKQVHPGVEHAQVTKEISGLNVKINLLRLDLKKVRLDVHHAFDKAIGMETTSSIAKRHNGVAAINAGFFRLDKSEFAGTAAGLLALDGRLLSETKNGRVAIGIVNSGKKTTVDFAHFNGFAIAGFGVDSEISFDGINQERKDDEIVIFTPEMGENTKTRSSGVEIVLTECKKREIASWCEKAAIYRDIGNSAIPRDGFVISIGSTAIPKSNNILYFAAGANKQPLEFGSIIRVVFNVAISTLAGSVAVAHIEDLTNGVPQLLKNGKVDITWEQEKASKSFVETRHPRTAVAKLKDGKFLMITVDGRSESSGGISLQDLAEYLLSLGAVDAMNLDGGGSTTMFLDGKVVNTPSDKEGERKIGDAIVVTLRKKK